MRVSTPTKLYEVKVVVGKGLGVFAGRDLKCGTRFMCDWLLIHLTQGNVMDVPAESAKLSPDKQALFLSLHCQRIAARDDTRTSIIRIQARLTSECSSSIH